LRLTIVMLPPDFAVFVTEGLIGPLAVRILHEARRKRA
jgi:hypothetical protein